MKCVSLSPSHQWGCHMVLVGSISGILSYSSSFGILSSATINKSALFYRPTDGFVAGHILYSIFENRSFHIQLKIRKNKYTPVRRTKLLPLKLTRYH